MTFFRRPRDMATLSNLRLEQLHWAAFACCAIVTAVALLGSSRFLSGAVASLRAAQAQAALPAPMARAPRPQATAARPDDLVGSLVHVQDSDALTRYVFRIAHEQGLAVLQMQSESLKADARHLSQTRSTLQVRGDYLSTKKLLIALLAKFPGLTLEHWTIRHRANGIANVPADAADRSDDESTIELIQYSRPLQADS